MKDMKELGSWEPGSFLSFIWISSALACIALALAVLPAQTKRAQTQKEIRITSQHVDGGPGELTSLEAPGGIPDDDFFSTAYSLGGEQVLWGAKHLDPPPSSIVVEVRGVGDVDRGAYIERHLSERFRELAMGATYVLFVTNYALGRSADAKVVWVPATGDGQSIIGIRNGNVAPQATTRLALSLALLTPAALFEKIRQIPGGKVTEGHKGPWFLPKPKLLHALHVSCEIRVD